MDDILIKAARILVFWIFGTFFSWLVLRYKGGVIVSHLIFFILKWTEEGAAVESIITIFTKQNKT